MYSYIQASITSISTLYRTSERLLDLLFSLPRKRTPLTLMTTIYQLLIYLSNDYSLCLFLLTIILIDSIYLRLTHQIVLLLQCSYSQAQIISSIQQATSQRQQTLLSITIQSIIRSYQLLLRHLNTREQSLKEARTLSQQ